VIQHVYLSKICYAFTDTGSGLRAFRCRIINIKIRGAALRCIVEELDGQSNAVDYNARFDFELYESMAEALIAAEYCLLPKDTTSRRDTFMQMNEYMNKALRTANLAKIGESGALLNAALGLNGEAGEIADILKKSTFQGHTLDEDALEKEVGDVLWYCALAAWALGTTLDDIANKNIQKLLLRYPNGFEAERSIHRVAEEVKADARSNV